VRAPSAECNSVRKRHAILPNTLGDLTSASKYFQTLPDPPGDKQSALRLRRSIVRCSWKHLQLWRCIGGAPSRIVKFRSSWDLCTDLRETLREAETSAQLCGILRQWPRPLRSSVGCLMPYSHSSGSYITTRHFVLSYSSVLQSQDSLHLNKACMIQVSLYIFIQSIWPQMVLEHNRRRPRPLRELLEMHRLNAVALKRSSKKVESPPSTLHRTSGDIRREFMRTSSSGLRSVRIGYEDMLLPGVEDPTQLPGSIISRVRPKSCERQSVYFHCMIR